MLEFYISINRLNMEDYLLKRNYLNHLKQMSAIKNGQMRHTLVISQPKRVANNTSTLRENQCQMNSTQQSKFATRRKKLHSSPSKKSTE